MSEMLSCDEYRIIVEQAPILIWRANATSGCDYFNDSWLSFRGRTLRQECGFGWSAGVHPADFERCLCAYREAFENRKPFEMEYRLLRHDGVYRWILDHGAPSYRPDGEFAGFVGSCVDVTERVEAQAALVRRKEAECEQLRSLLPLCAYCRKIRDDDGYWKRVEDFLSEQTHTEFTHGICPECIEEVGAAVRGAGRFS